MPNFIDLSGKVFNNLTVIKASDEKHVSKEKHWVCKCSCGKEIILPSYTIRHGKSKSCGCLQHKGTHKMSNRPEFRTWAGMIQRCKNPNKTEYRYYGGRGIKVCERWAEKGNGFKNFYDDMGPKPNPSYSLDRIDSNGNYCKENCKWATPQEQWDNRKQISLSVKTYQDKTANTAIYPKDDKLWSVSYCLLGIGSEAGELCGIYKKMIRDNCFDLTAEVKRKIIDEAGDLAWYLSQLCTELDVSLEYVLKHNIEKLRSRQERGKLQGSGDNR